MRIMFAKKDKDNSPPFPIKENEAGELNSKGYGIFITVNEFKSEVRRKDNVKKILSWFFEVDSNTPTLDCIVKKSLIPSLVVKTKNGYHVYFNALNATENNYAKIQLRLNELFSADPNARDITRMLRAPNYYHHKTEPFLVSSIFETDAIYREEAMLIALPKSLKEKEDDVVIKKEMSSLKHLDSNDFGDWITSQNQMTLLTQLSGTSLVGFDYFEFYETSKGYNTKTNGKPSSWFIDELGRIGSASGGGPTVIQFVAWYLIRNGMNYNDSKVKSFLYLKEFFRG